MLRRMMIIALTLLTTLAAARAEGPYCVVAGDVALLADDAGNVVVPQGSCEDLFTVIEGSLYAVGAPGDYDLVDAEGQPVGEQRCAMYDAEGNVIVFRQGWRYGAMDRQGNVLVDPVWTQLTPDGREGWLALADSAIDEIADELYHIRADGVAEETGVTVLGILRGVRGDRMACCGADGLWGYVDGAGREALAFQWRAAGDFADGRAIVCDEAGYGVIDATGKAVIGTGFAHIVRVGSRFAALDDAGRLTLFDGETGDIKAVIDEVEGVTALADAMVLSGDETRLLSADGRKICAVSAAGSFAEGVDGQFIATDGAWGAEASWVVNPDGSPATGKYQRLLPLCRDRYAYMTLAGETYFSEALGETRTRWDYESLRYGMIDGSGGMVLPAEYRMIRALDEERLLLMTEADVRMADRNGAVIATWPRPQSGAASDEAGE